MAFEYYKLGKTTMWNSVRNSASLYVARLQELRDLKNSYDQVSFERATFLKTSEMPFFLSMINQHFHSKKIYEFGIATELHEYVAKTLMSDVDCPIDFIEKQMSDDFSFKTIVQNIGYRADTNATIKYNALRIKDTPKEEIVKSIINDMKRLSDPLPLCQFYKSKLDRIDLSEVDHDIRKLFIDCCYYTGRSR